VGASSWGRGLPAAAPGGAFTALLALGFGAGELAGAALGGAGAASRGPWRRLPSSGPALVALALARVPLAAALLLTHVVPVSGGWVLPEELGGSDTGVLGAVAALGLSHGAVASLGQRRALSRALSANGEAASALLGLCSAGGLFCGCAAGWALCLLLTR